MILVRINDQLRVDAEAAQRLVHLLTALDWHVEIAFAAEKQRRCLDAIGMQERIRDLLVSLPRFGIPRRADFVIVLNDVLIGAVESDGESRPGAAGCSLETRVGSDHVVGKNRAIAPTAHSQAVRIGYTHLNRVIDSGFQIFHFVMTPVGEDRPRIFLATT